MNTFIFEPEILVREFNFFGDVEKRVHWEQLLTEYPLTQGFLLDDSVIEMQLVKAGTRTETYIKRYRRG